MSSPAEEIQNPIRIVSALSLACGVIALAAAAAPADILGRLVTVIDPARTPRQLIEIDIGVRAGLAVLGSTLLARGSVMRTFGPALLGRLVTSSPTSPRPTLSPATRWDMVALAGLVLIGTGLRVEHVALPLEADEATTYVLFASRTLIDIVSDYSTPNNHILHSVLVGISTGLFGPHPAALRAPAFLAGLAAMPIVFLLGRRERSTAVALALTALVAVGPPFVEFSGRARGYTIQFLLLLWCLFAARELVRGGRPRHWLHLGLASALGMWTSPSFMLPLGGIALWLPLQRREGAFVGRLALVLAAAALLTVLLYSPVLVRSGWESLAEPDAWDAKSLSLLPGAVANQARLLGRCWGGGLGPLAWPALLLMTAGLLLGWRRGDPWAALVAVCLLWFVALTVLRGLRPRARMFNWLLPLWFLGAALLPARAGRAAGAWVDRWRGVVVVALALAWGAAQLHGHAARRAELGAGHDSENFCAGGYIADAQSLARTFAAIRADGDIMVVPAYSGMINPIRFHLMRDEVSPAAVVTPSPGRGVSPLAGFPRWYVAAPKARTDYSSRLPALNEMPLDGVLARVAGVLGADADELSRLVARIGVEAELPMTILFRLDLQPEATRATRRPADRHLVEFAW